MHRKNIEKVNKQRPVDYRISPHISRTFLLEILVWKSTCVLYTHTTKKLKVWKVWHTPKMTFSSQMRLHVIHVILVLVSWMCCCNLQYIPHINNVWKVIVNPVKYSQIIDKFSILKFAFVFGQAPAKLPVWLNRLWYRTGIRIQIPFASVTLCNAIFETKAFSSSVIQQLRRILKKCGNSRHKLAIDV